MQKVNLTEGAPSTSKDSIFSIKYQLILVRHGEYQNNLKDSKSRQLTLYGRRCMNAFSDKVLVQIKGTEKISMLSSTASMARESADIVSNKLEPIRCSLSEVFWSGGQHREQFDKAFSIIQNRGKSADIVIVVTHKEFIEKFPRYFIEKMSESQINSDILKIEKGSGVWIDNQLQISMI